MKNKIFSSGMIATVIMLALNVLSVHGQYTMPEVMDTGTVQQQLDYVENRTRIYNDFRAIREDIFQKMKKNNLDTLSASKTRISQLEKIIKESSDEIASLENKLVNTEEQLNEAVKNKNALTFVGIQMNKKFYNSLMWLIVAGLAVFLVILFLVYRRNHAITSEYKNALDETREEFENYKKESRERYEKLVVNHHNEIMKLKGN